MILLRSLLLVSVLLLSACESLDGKHILTTAAGGTEIQAERLVAKMLGKPAKPLPYAAADIDQPLARMQARWPQIVAELNRGRIGMTDDGLLRVRSAEAQTPALKKLVRAENLDRQLMYRGLCAEVGYYGGNVIYWLPFTEDTFAQEWQKQAPAGWWYLDENGRWQQKTVPATDAGKKN